MLLAPRLPELPPPDDIELLPPPELRPTDALCDPPELRGAGAETRGAACGAGAGAACRFWCEEPIVKV